MTSTNKYTIERTRNRLALDLTADALDLLLNNIKEMEHMTAFGMIEKQLNILTHSRTFKNKLDVIDYGKNGKGGMFDLFIKSARIALGTYRFEDEWFNRIAAAAAKNVNMAKIAFKPNIALQQLSSMPAFFVETQGNKYFYAEFSKALFNPMGSYEWAMENLPLFKKRMQQGNAGDERITGDLTKFARVGMFPNRIADGLASAIGARGVYNANLRRYLDMGYTEDRAKYQATIDAELAYNQTQQSSEGLFLSEWQVGRSLTKIFITSFRNFAIGAQRKLAGACRTLTKYYKKKASLIEFEKKRLLRDGLSEEAAAEWAERNVNNAARSAVWRIAMYTIVSGFVYHMSRSLIDLIGGDDDDIFENAIIDSLAHGVSGLIGGETLQNLISMVLKGDDYRELFGDLSVVQDIERAVNKILHNPDAMTISYELLRLGGEMSMGFDLDVAANWMAGIEGAVSDGLTTWEDVALGVKRALVAPNSTIKRYSLLPREAELIRNGDSNSVAIDKLNSYFKRAARYYRYYEKGIFGALPQTVDLNLLKDFSNKAAVEEYDLSEYELKRIKSDYMEYLMERKDFKDEYKDQLKLKEKVDKYKKKLRRTRIGDLTDIEHDAEYMELMQEVLGI